MRELFDPDRLFDMTKSIAAPIFEGVSYPWEVLPEIGAFVVKLGQSLSEEEYERAGKDVWIARDATVAPTASITLFAKPSGARSSLSSPDTAFMSSK